MHACFLASVYIYMYMCVYIYMYVCMYIHIHTHTRIYRYAYRLNCEIAYQKCEPPLLVGGCSSCGLQAIFTLTQKPWKGGDSSRPTLF